MEAARQIDALNAEGHGLISWATDVDPFPWSSIPRMLLASDVLMLGATQPSGRGEDMKFDGAVLIEIALSQPINPNASEYALACARWEAAVELWTTRNCSLSGVAANVARCVCLGPGIFTAAWAPLLLTGASQTPLLPLGSPSSLVPVWLPIAVALILLFLMGLLLLLFCCYKHAAPPLSQPLKRTLLGEGEGESEDWTTHLKRPAHLHTGAMPPDTGVIFYENTSSGEDDWPDQPDLSRVNGPLLPRAERQPFVGGRVALLRDLPPGAMFEGQVLLAPANNVFDRAALPYSDEQRRYDRQLGIEESEQFSSEETKKGK